MVIEQAIHPPWTTCQVPKRRLRSGEPRGLEKPTPDVGQETRGRRFHQIEDLFETTGGPIIGIRNLPDPQVRRKVHEQPQLGFGPTWADCGKILKIVPVHGQHVVEPREVLGCDETGA